MNCKFMRDVIDTALKCWIDNYHIAEEIRSIFKKESIRNLIKAFIDKFIFNHSDNFYRKLVSISLHILPICEQDNELSPDWYEYCSFPLSNDIQTDYPDDPIYLYGIDKEIINSYDLFLEVIQAEMQKLSFRSDAHVKNMVNILLYQDIQERCLRHCNDLFISSNRNDISFYDKSDEITFAHYYLEKHKDVSLAQAYYYFCLQCEKNFEERNYIKNTDALLDILKNDQSLTDDELEVYTIADIDQMTGLEFEYFLGKLYKTLNYSVLVTKASQDQGADLIVEKNGIKEVIQAKHYESAKVGNKAVQEAIAAKTYYRCDIASVITNNYFTKQACQLAESSSIKLINRDNLITVLEMAKISKNEDR